MRRHPRGTPHGQLRRQTGATLVVGLVLLLVLTVLGVSGMNMATLEITMASNTQFQQDAFQAAETGIDVPIAQRNFTTFESRTNEGTVGDGSYESETVFVDTTPVPDIAFSMGTSTGSVQAFHFNVRSVGTGPRNAVSTHVQSFYIVGPGGP
ncbi:MAG TPA: pilus assembly PilX N-terminal domain-containing protein [Gammaproteobacteria bacterium]